MARYQSKYPAEVRGQAIKLLRQGASPVNVELIIGVEEQTVCKWRDAEGLKQTEKSKLYPRISRFAERRLRYAARRGMDICEVDDYAGVGRGLVAGFWRKIGHNYITSDQAEKIRHGLSAGANKPQITRYAGITDVDLEYFLEIEDLDLEEYNPSNPLAVTAVSPPRQHLPKLRTLKLKTPGHDTMKYVRELIASSEDRTITSSQLLAHINANIRNDEISLSAASKRLIKAHERGLLEREWNGKGWVYRLKPTVSASASPII